MILENVRIKYAALTETDDNDKYKVIFTFNDDKDAKKLKKTIMKYLEENKPKGAKDKPDNVPFLISEPNEEYPDDEDIGRLIFIATKNEKSKEGKDLGGVQVFRADGEEYDEDDIPNIGSGTMANVIVDMFVWTFKRNHGVSLWVNKVQILDLKEFSGGESFGNEKKKKKAKFKDDEPTEKSGGEKKKDKKKKKKNKKKDK